MNLTVQVKQVQTQRELEQCLGLRYKVFVEEMQITRLQSHNQEQDRYDEHAIHFLITIDGIPVGTNRIIPYQNKVGLPIETQWNIKPFSRGKIAEISQFCILKEYRSPRVFAYLSRVLFIYAEAHGYDFYFVNANPGERFSTLDRIMDSPFIRTLERMGFNIFDTPRMYKKVGKMGVPMFLKLENLCLRIKKEISKPDKRFIINPLPHVSLNSFQGLVLS